jgi:poly(hydroxyalkanoate) granule-associated protein
MVVKRVKSKAAVKQKIAKQKVVKQSVANQNEAEKAQALWLAGLGAFSIAQKQGGDLFAGLIAEGKDLQARAVKLKQNLRTTARAQIKQAIAPLRSRAKYDAKKLAAGVQHSVAAVLARLGIPSKADVEELTQRVAALSRRLKTAK